MPTPSGLPKPGEIWQRTYRLPEPGGEWKTHTVVFLVKQRGTGSFWSMHVDVLEAEGTLMSAQDYNVKNALWVDSAYWMQQGELTFIKKDDGRPWAQQRKTVGLEDQQEPDDTRGSLHRKLVEAMTYASVLYCDDGPHAGAYRLDLFVGEDRALPSRYRPVYLTADEVAVFKGQRL